MSHLRIKEKACVMCNKRYKPTGMIQRFCSNCGLINKKEKDRLYSLSNKAIQYRRQYNRSEIGKAKYKRYRSTEKYKRYSRNRYHSEKENIRKARYFLSNAVRDGRLNRSNVCEKCGTKDWGIKRSMIEAHHYKGYDPDYWLIVQWLCVTCHKLADAGKEVG